MTISAVKDWARVLCRANIPAFVMGAHGLGKTSAIYQLYAESCAERGRQQVLEFSQVMSSLDGKKLARQEFGDDDYGLWAVSAANVTSEELIGMPHVDDRDAVYRQVWLETLQAASRLAHDDQELAAVHERVFARAAKALGVSEEDKGRRVLRYLRMHSLLPPPTHRGGGIWIVDELNLGFVEVEKALMQMLLERRYLDYVLPDNVWVVTTMNPPCPSYPGARELALPTLDRGALITVEPDKGEWLDWAAKRRLSETSRLFVDRHDSALLNPVKLELRLDEFKNPATYRSVEMVDRAYAVMSEEEIKTVGLLVATSLLGREAAILYHREHTEASGRPLSLDDVVDGYGWRSTMTEAEVRDHKSWPMTRSRNRVREMVNHENVKMELINYTLTEIKNWLDGLGEDLRSRGSSERALAHTDKERGRLLNVLTFLSDIPVDAARAFVVSYANRIDVFNHLFGWPFRGYPIIRHLHFQMEVKATEACGGDLSPN